MEGRSKQMEIVINQKVGFFVSKHFRIFHPIIRAAVSGQIRYFAFMPERGSVHNIAMQRFFFFLYGRPEAPRCRRSYGMVRPLDRPLTNSPAMKTSSFFLILRF
jgi:hypothetical protein